MITDLTPENFWTEMKTHYPKAVTAFGRWIDQYKVDNDWDKLFKEIATVDGLFSYIPAPKYHQLPWAIQFGIWLEFRDSLRQDRKLIPRPYTFETISKFIEADLDSLQSFLEIEPINAKS